MKTPLMAWVWGVKIGKGVKFDGKTILRSFNRGSISIGQRVSFVSRVEINVTGLDHPTILDTRWGGRITIGDDSGFSAVAMSTKESITIGRRVKCGGNVRIFDHNFHSLDAALRNSGADMANTRSSPVVIGDDVFIGANAMILKGSEIGDRCIVAAGSVVFGLKVPPDSLVRGNPAVVTTRKCHG